MCVQFVHLFLYKRVGLHFSLHEKFQYLTFHRCRSRGGWISKKFALHYTHNLVSNEWKIFFTPVCGFSTMINFLKRNQKIRIRDDHIFQQKAYDSVSIDQYMTMRRAEEGDEERGIWGCWEERVEPSERKPLPCLCELWRGQGQLGGRVSRAHPWEPPPSQHAETAKKKRPDVLELISWALRLIEIHRNFDQNIARISFAAIRTISRWNLIRNASAPTCKLAFGDSVVLFGTASSVKCQQLELAQHCARRGMASEVFKCTHTSTSARGVDLNFFF